MTASKTLIFTYLLLVVFLLSKLFLITSVSSSMLWQKIVCPKLWSLTFLLAIWDCPYRFCPEKKMPLIPEKVSLNKG